MRRLAATIGVLALVTGLAGPVVGDSVAGADRLINSGHEGQRFDYRPMLVHGKLNIIDFYSQYCPPCRAIMPRLEKLAETDHNLMVLRIDINRPQVEGIDWDSPVSQEYGLHSIPHFVVYDANGKQLATDGDDSQQASQIVDTMLQKAGL